MERFLFSGNGPYLNRGCEAIVRGTVRILRESFDKPTFVNANFDRRPQPVKPPETDPDITHAPMATMERGSTRWLLWRLLRRTHRQWAEWYHFRQLKPLIRQSEAVLSIGGDNYSLDYGLPLAFMDMGEYVRQCKKPLVIWGASIGPFESFPEFAPSIISHLRDRVDAIFVRERRSFDYLAERGVRENVYLMADPAFMMEPESLGSGAAGFHPPPGSIGVNVSPLMLQFVSNPDRAALVKRCVSFVTDLKRIHRRSVVLIPHVFVPDCDDGLLLSEVYAHLPDRDEVHLVPAHSNAAQIKGVISQLECLIAARTHATIAALSSGIPTVSLAYSTKAYGLNESLFGHTDYVVSVQDFYADRAMATTTRVLNDAMSIRRNLKRTLPEQQRLALEAGRNLRQILARFNSAHPRRSTARHSAGQ